jgi:hypothetical protein
LLLGLRIFVALCHLFNSVRRLSATFDIFRQDGDASTIFDAFRRTAAQIGRPATGSQAENTGSGT